MLVAFGCLTGIGQIFVLPCLPCLFSVFYRARDSKGYLDAFSKIPTYDSSDANLISLVDFLTSPKHVPRSDIATYQQIGLL